MSKFDAITERAMEIAGTVGDGLKSRIPGLTKSLPDRAIEWVQTGAAIGALRTGARAATTVARRNPAIALATVAGAGLAYYLVRRHQKKVAAGQPIEGSATRIEATRAAPRPRATAKRSARRTASED